LPPQWLKNIDQYYGKIRVNNISILKLSINKVGSENIEEISVTLTVPQWLKNIISTNIMVRLELAIFPLNTQLNKGIHPGFILFGLNKIVNKNI